MMSGRAFAVLADERGRPIEIATTERDLAWLSQEL
jgi:hypothetical protein